MTSTKTTQYDSLLKKARGDRGHARSREDLGPREPGHHADGLVRSDGGCIVKPDPWCCICERYIADTAELVRANELVVHRTCYSRAEKFFRSSETHPCEIEEADLMFETELCGRPATKQVDCGAGCMHWVCDEHAQAQK